MKDLSQVATLHARQLKDEDPWIWLYEFEDASDPTKRYRLTNHPVPINYGEDDDGDPLTYSPASIAHGGVTYGLNADLPTITINIGNSILVSHAIDQGDGFTGRAARIIIVSRKELANPESAIVENVEIIRVKCTQEVVSLEMGAGNLYKQTFPPRLFSRRKCGWIFGDLNCGYNIDADLASFTECPGYDFAACEAVGADEDANPNIAEAQHPQRFGGFLGIPKGRGR